MDLQVFDVAGHPVDFCALGPAAASGPALVLHHGGQCDAADFANIAGPLSRHRRVILIDRFVHEPDPWHVWLLLNHLLVDRAVLLGHSAGGKLMRAMYRLCPQRVTAMIDVDASAFGAAILARKLPQDRLSPLAAALYRRHEAQMKTLAPHHQGDYPSLVTIERRLKAYQRAKLSPEQRSTCRPPPRLFQRLENPPPAPAPCPDEGKFVTCPLLVVHTGRGKLGPEDITPAWIESNIQARQVQYQVIKESGHWPWVEDPAGFMALVEPFLKQAGC